MDWREEFDCFFFSFPHHCLMQITSHTIPTAICSNGSYLLHSLEMENQGSTKRCHGEKLCQINVFLGYSFFTLPLPIQQGWWKEITSSWAAEREMVREKSG